MENKQSISYVNQEMTRRGFKDEKLIIKVSDKYVKYIKEHPNDREAINCLPQILEDLGLPQQNEEI